MVRLQVLVVFAVLVAVSNIEGRAYRRTFADPSIVRALEEYRRNAACKIDLGLVMDDTKGNFSLIKDFVKHLVGKFQISDDGTHVGAITFGKIAVIRLLFSDLKGSENSLQSVKKQIDSWHEDFPLENKNTRIGKALSVAKDFLFTVASGMRSKQAKQVLLLFTNGKEDQEQEGYTLSKAQELLKKGIKVITVGIEIPDPIELSKIAGNKIKNVHFLKAADRIDSIATEIVQSVCGQA